MTEIKILEKRRINSGAGLLGVIGRSHTLPTAVADLLDNSLTAKASAVNIRFNDQGGRLQSIRIRDNGSGMNGEQLDRAMQLSPAAEGSQPDGLGMFGVGLKASSFSIGARVEIFACPKAGEYFGVVLDEQTASDQPEYGLISSQDAEQGFLSDLGRLEPEDPASTGVVIEISKLHAAPNTKRERDLAEWLSNTINELALHLGLVFHRFISDGRIEISIERFAVDAGRPGAATFAEALDPLSFPSSPVDGFPCELTATSPLVGTLGLRCVIVPPGSKTAAVQPLGRSREQMQGLYLYWRDRLVDFAGWHTLQRMRREHQLARASLDISQKMVDEGLVRLNKEKTAVNLRPPVIGAIHEARDPTGEKSFAVFLSRAEETLRSANRRKPKAKPLTRAGSGVPEAVKTAIEATVGWQESGRQVKIEWKFLPEEQLFDVDFEDRSVILNSRHRVLLSNTEDNTEEDAPIVRALFFLLLEGHLSGQRVGPSSRDQIDGYREVASAALELQLREVELQAERDEARGVSVVPEPPKKASPGAKTELLEPLQTSKKLSGDEGRGLEAPNSKTPSPISVAEFKKKARESVVFADQAGPIPEIGTAQVVALLKAYRSGTALSQIASESGLTEREAVQIIGQEIFGEIAVRSNTDFAARHGLPWDPPERERLRRDFQECGDPVKIAAKLQRTNLGVTWQLLKLPEHPVRVTPNLIRRVSKKKSGK